MLAQVVAFPVRYVLLLVALQAILLGGCCLKSVTVTPEIAAADLKTFTAGNAKAAIDLQLQDCCPSKQQKAVALQLQTKLAAAFDDVLERKITVDEYNAYRGAVMNALTNVVLVCNAHAVSGARAMTLPSIDDAWNKVQEVLNKPPRKGQHW
jgi:hypothetical protein